MRICPSCGLELPDDTRFCPKDGAILHPETEGDDLAGRVIAERYHVLEKLGEGGMGAVYLAEHVRMGLKVAIKVITPAMANEPEVVARFHREARNAASIKHPNVCTVFDFGETPDGLVYLAMEYLEGETLAEALRREGAFAPRRAAGVLMQCADALQAAHDLDIVHRDFKPENVMLTPARDGADLVTVLDFGIAKAAAGEGAKTLTRPGYIIGTPDYMSPEQAAAGEPDARSDIYALGLVLFRMLTGRLPFHATTPQESLVKRLTDEPLRLDQVTPGAGFPPQVQAVLDRALARKREGRYESVMEFAREAGAELRALPESAGGVPTGGATRLVESAGAPERATPETPQPRARRRRAPSRKRLAVMLVATAGGVAAALALGVALFTGPPGEERAPAAGDSAAASEAAAAGRQAKDPEARPSPAPDAELGQIEALIAQGRPRTALERLDMLRPHRTGDLRVEELIASAVMADVEARVTSADFEGALAELRRQIEIRPYLETLAPALDSLALRYLAYAVKRHPNPDAIAVHFGLARANAAQLETRYRAAVLMVGGRQEGLQNTGFDALSDILREDPAFRERIMGHVRENLAVGWASSGALSLAKTTFYDDLRSELLRRLDDESDTVRLNAYLALRDEDRRGRDLLSYHLRNVRASHKYVRDANQRSAVLGPSWENSIDYFYGLAEPTRVSQALAALRAARDSLASAPGEWERRLQGHVDTAVARLEAGVVAIPFSGLPWRGGIVDSVPARYAYEFIWTWWDVGAEGAEDFRQRASVVLELDGQPVADRSRLGAVAPGYARDCGHGARLPCRQRVVWRYRQTPLAPGSHRWTLRVAYDDRVEPVVPVTWEYAGVIVVTEATVIRSDWRWPDEY